MRSPRAVEAMLLLLSLTISASTRANAADDPQTSEVRRRFEAGMAHFNLREYKPAIEDFEAAYRLRPDPVFLYNLGQSYRLAEDPEQALYFYRAYLRTSDNPPNRDEVEGRLVTLQKLLADRQRIPSSPPVTMTAASPTPRSKPLYKRWWLWTIVGIAGGAAAVGLGVGLTAQKSATFNANVGTVGPAALTLSPR